VEGVVEPPAVVKRLSACDVLLFVRGGISTRRSSAIAGIACGVPLIAFVGSETAYPITDAGVLLVSPLNPDELKDALVRVLSDPELRAALRLKNLTIYSEHFSWPSIATRFVALLRM
jgi:glycosyltransferase involved in cell wall biosynthesis